MKHNGETDALLEVKNLEVSFPTREGEVRAVNGISYSVKKGEIMGLVGESGSGKSVEAYSITGLLPPSAVVKAGSVLFEDRDTLKMTEKDLTELRGREISMIFQNPMSSLDPVFKIGKQMVETIRAHDKMISKRAASELSKEMLREVGIHNTERIFDQYSFELSGGMCQRVMIATALLGNPKLLIADEPTTALDVTHQAQIVHILKKTQKQRNMAIIYITHNLGIVAELCDRVSIMCGGYILEQGTVDEIFYNAVHPYTRLLLKTIPRMDVTTKTPLVPIEGVSADPLSPPDGCVFHPRCPSCTDICRQSVPHKTVLSPEHSASCWLLDKVSERVRT